MYGTNRLENKWNINGALSWDLLQELPDCSSGDSGLDDGVMMEGRVYKRERSPQWHAEVCWGFVVKVLGRVTLETCWER